MNEKEKNNDERLVGNVGFGKRYLSDDKLSFTGVNLFLDADDNGNKRTSRTTASAGNHTHTVKGNSNTTGGAETRPVNYGVNYIIKL